MRPEIIAHSGNPNVSLNRQLADSEAEAEEAAAYGQIQQRPRRSFATVNYTLAERGNFYRLKQLSGVVIRNFFQFRGIFSSPPPNQHAHSSSP